MTTTERKAGLGGYEAASERRSEPKEPPMTKTQDELLAAVERAEEGITSNYAMTLDLAVTEEEKVVTVRTFAKAVSS